MATKIKQSKIKAVNKTFSDDVVLNDVLPEDDNIKADLVNGKVPESQLPSYVDDVLEYANSSSFPAEGEAGKIYVALNTNITYRWSGSAYVQIGPENDIVLANPTLDGTESALEGLQIGNNKYKVSNHLYEHCITINLKYDNTLTNVSIYFQKTFYTQTQTQINTVALLGELLYNRYGNTSVVFNMKENSAYAWKYISQHDRYCAMPPVLPINAGVSGSSYVCSCQCTLSYDNDGNTSYLSLGQSHINKIEDIVTQIF